MTSKATKPKTKADQNLVELAVNVEMLAHIVQTFALIIQEECPRSSPAREKLDALVKRSLTCSDHMGKYIREHCL